jgi:hypothetical protein
MFRSSALRRVVLASSILTCAFGASSAPLRAQQPTTQVAGSEVVQSRVLNVAPETTLRYSAPWTESTAKYANAHELVRAVKTPADQGARIVITTEQRLDHADSKQRLVDIALRNA